MTRPTALLFLIVALVWAALAACGDFPGADGRYATHDRGRNNHP